MIITLAGVVTHKNDVFAVLEAGGVGYQVFMNVAALAVLPVGAQARLWTHEYLREDSRELYGFASLPEHKLFRKLLSISGVGPKMAMNLLTLGTVAEIERVIERGDIVRLSSISGVGKKTAQKIVLELKGKLMDAESGEDEEVIVGLMNLGYSREKARTAIARVPAGPEGRVEDRLRAALRELGK
jgi:Holliday junction DNA helicase RuvA